MMETTVGVGIPTYNRLESLKKTINSLKENTTIRYDLMVAVDGANDGTIDWLNENKYEYVSQNRQGVCAAKNHILRRFSKYDYIFIVEDDVRFMKPNVFSIYIEAIRKFQIHHFNFLIPSQRIKAKPPRKMGNLEVMYSRLLGGCFSTYTKEIVRKVGGFNPKFKGYGHGHCEYTLRIARARLTSPWHQFAHLVNSEQYIYHSDHKTSNTKEEILQQKNKNHEILKESLRNSKLIYMPLV